MNGPEVLTGPAFGQADLTNCETELIHLAGSIQPHGLLLLLDEDELRIRKCSANAAALLGTGGRPVLDRMLGEFDSGIELAVREALTTNPNAERKALRCSAGLDTSRRDYEGLLHRLAGGGLILELEAGDDADPSLVAHREDAVRKQLAAALEEFGSAPTIETLADRAVLAVRAMTGYDRVMVYKFDPDGHGEIIAEARAVGLDSLVGHHYPATDIPQRARELYLRNRVRVLVDVDYEPVPIGPDAGQLDLSLSYLRSMSPLHLQYLRNMGVTATLVVSLVREGRLWGLIACHHYSPRRMRYLGRAACEVMAEVISTRITAIENYAHAQGVILVRALEQRLIDATSTDGDWKRALFRQSRTLLQPLSASGAALFFEGEILTTGEVPSTPELRQLVKWVTSSNRDSLFATNTAPRDNPELTALTPTASGVLAAQLSSSRPDYLMWFRREQLSTVTWAGDPSKAVIDNDPLNLSPRRSFASWVQTVRATSQPWSRADLALARAISATLVDIILQIQSVRLLIAQHQLDLVRVTVENSREPVIIAGDSGRVLFSNGSLAQLLPADARMPETLDELPGLFTDALQVNAMLRSLREQRLPWRGELRIASRSGQAVPVGVRADLVPGARGEILGFILIFTDLSDAKRADAARRRFEDVLQQARHDEGATSRQPDEVMGAILSNARLAALDIADDAGDSGSASLIEELEAATRRATAMYAQLRSFGTRKP